MYFLALAPPPRDPHLLFPIHLRPHDQFSCVCWASPQLCPPMSNLFEIFPSHPPHDPRRSINLPHSQMAVLLDLVCPCVRFGSPLWTWPFLPEAFLLNSRFSPNTLQCPRNLSFWRPVEVLLGIAVLFLTPPPLPLPTSFPSLYSLAESRIPRVISLLLCVFFPRSRRFPVGFFF